MPLKTLLLGSSNMQGWSGVDGIRRRMCNNMGVQIKLDVVALSETKWKGSEVQVWFWSLILAVSTDQQEGCKGNREANAALSQLA